MATSDPPDPQNVVNALVTVTVERGPTAVLVIVTGEVDLLTAPRLRQAIHDVLEERPPVLVLDLLGVDFLASAGLSLLVEAQVAAAPHTHLRIVAAGPATLRPLQITGLTDPLSIHPTRADALGD